MNNNHLIFQSSSVINYLSNAKPITLSLKHLEPQIMVKVVPVTSKTMTGNVNCTESSVSKRLLDLLNADLQNTLQQDMSSGDCNGINGDLIKKTQQNNFQIGFNDFLSAKVKAKRKNIVNTSAYQRKSNFHFTPPPILVQRFENSSLKYKIKANYVKQQENFSNFNKAKINIGKKYQAYIPNVIKSSSKDNSTCIWKPSISSDKTIHHFLRMSKSYFNLKEEDALDILFRNDGNIYQTITNIINRSLKLENFDVWNQLETRNFFYAIHKYGKRFEKISKEVSSKSAKECVEFYYRTRALE